MRKRRKEIRANSKNISTRSIKPIRKLDQHGSPQPFDNRIQYSGNFIAFRVVKNMSDVTQILSQLEAGDPTAAERLLPIIYEDLRRQARAMMAIERSDHTLQATALVHDAYLRLIGNDASQHWNSRGHFFCAAAEAMRRILIESARKKNALKRSGNGRRVELDDDVVTYYSGSIEDLLDFNALLERLATIDSAAAEVVKLKLFAGLSIEEIANSLGISRSTAYENWKFARAWFATQVLDNDE